MPRASTAAQRPDTDEDDGQPRRSHAPAGSKPPPATTGAASVFALGQQAKPRRASPSRLDLAKVTIRRGVPIPDKETSGESAYAALLARMQPGDIVELTDKQMYSMAKHAKKLGVAITRRKLDSGLYGIWRT